MLLLVVDGIGAAWYYSVADIRVFQDGVGLL